MFQTLTLMRLKVMIRDGHCQGSRLNVRPGVTNKSVMESRKRNQEGLLSNDCFDKYAFLLDFMFKNPIFEPSTVLARGS